MRTYSEKYLNSYKILKEARIGFEFEFFSNVSYYKTLEILNEYLQPVKTWGFRTYHSDFKPDENNFKLEPDLSGGQNMAEIITGPLDYFDARYFLLKILKFIGEYGYTNDRCSLHINISFGPDSDKPLRNLNILKHILSMDEEAVYKVFPSRRNNIYAKSVKKMIPFKDYDFSNVDIGIIKNVIRIPKDKYYGINLSNINETDSARIEYRYLGGKDYEKKSGDILDFTDQFIINCYENINGSFNNDDIEELEKFLDKNINMFKQFSKYDNFIVEFPQVQLQIDQQGQYDVVNAYYPRLYKKLFSIIESTEGLNDCVVNFVSESQRMEIVDGSFKCVMNISNYDFINCNIQNGMFENCELIDSELINTQLTKCKVVRTEIKNSKLIASNAENSDLKNCFFMSGYLDSYMEGGIFRSGKIGPHGTLSPETKIVTGKESFFGIKHDEIDKAKGKGKGLSKFKG